MADISNRFVGSSGVFMGRTADFGDTWAPSGTTVSINSSGSAYSFSPTSAATDVVGMNSWTPPGTDYAVSIVIDAGLQQPDMEAGVVLRGTSASVSNSDQYSASLQAGSPDALAIFRAPAIGYASDSVSRTSVDLPLHTATAAISLPAVTVTSRRGVSREQYAADLQAQRVSKPDSTPPIMVVPLPLAVANAEPRTRPAISDARPSKAKLDFPMGGH